MFFRTINTTFCVGWYRKRSTRKRRWMMHMKYEDHSSFDFISAVHIWFLSYASFIYISFTGTYEPKIDLLPNVSGFIAQLVERRTGIARSRVQAPLKFWIFFFQASLRNCKNCDHNCEDHCSFDFISAVHIWFLSYASFNIHCVKRVLWPRAFRTRNISTLCVACFWPHAFETKNIYCV